MRIVRPISSIVHCNLNSNTIQLVVTDSPKLKQWISRKYSSKTRQVVTTPTRPSQTPSIDDVVEALIDWYLIGEADVVITDKESPMFGGTAALQTARPLYNANQCVQLSLLHNETSRATLPQAKKHPPRVY